MGPRTADALSCRIGAAIFPHVAGYNSAKKAVIFPRVADIILQKIQTNGPAHRGCTILPDGRSNLSACCGIQFCKKSSNLSAICGYYSAKKSRPMGPRTADALSCRIGAAIFPHVAGYNSAKKAVIFPQYADIVLQMKADQWARAPRMQYTHIIM